MKKKNNLNSLLYKSNTFNYGQLLLNNIVILTIKSDFFKNKSSSLQVKVLKILYNNKIISYTTLIFFLNKTKKIINSKSDFSFLKVLTELGWESGILVKNNKKCKSIIYHKK
jgi:hypothetical protein